VNVMSMIGLGSVRGRVVGAKDPATPAKLKAMVAMVQASLAASVADRATFEQPFRVPRRDSRRAGGWGRTPCAMANARRDSRDRRCGWIASATVALLAGSAIHR
jgi:hypothetical protein